MIYVISVIIAFVVGFVLRGYIIDKNHNVTLLNHSSDISRFLKESQELKNKINFLRKRNKILENRISALIFILKKSGGNPEKQPQSDLNQNIKSLF